MARADVLTLVTSLAVSQDDTTAAGNYYDNIVLEHGLTRESLTDASFVAVTKGTTTYTLPTAAVRGLGAIHDDVWLYQEDKRGAETLDPRWKELEGEPRAFSLDELAQRSFDVIPAPARSGASIGGLTPFTAVPGDFPADNLTVIFTENATDVQAWEELAVACEILKREFSRDSDHQDTAAAEAWGKLSELLLGMADA